MQVSFRHAAGTLCAAVLALSAGQALAHIGYGSGAPLSSTSRNFGDLVNGSSGTVSARTATSNFGWADASDASLAFDSAFAASRPGSSDEAGWGLGGFSTGVDNLYFGDSHKGAAFRFHLDSALSVTVSLSGVSGVTGALGGALTPAFSVYKGLAALAPLPGTQTSADYDFSAASRAQRTSWAQSMLGPGFTYLASQGNWNALGDWVSGGDGDPAGDLSALSLFQYVGSAASTTAGGSAMRTLTLGPGDYSIFVGGNDLTSKTQAASPLKYGFEMTVSAVPEPGAALLLAAGLPLLLALRRRTGADRT